VNIVSGLLRFALKRGVVAHNVVRDLDRDDRPGAARQAEPRCLTAAELDALLAKMSDTFRPVAFACPYAALRISEALGLRWRDVDFKAGTITVAGQLGAKGERLARTKTPSSAATLPLLPVLRRELQAHRSRQASRTSRSCTLTRSSSRPRAASRSRVETRCAPFTRRATRPG
jgi:integrase